jgi:hypothetical protein
VTLHLRGRSIEQERIAQDEIINTSQDKK